MPTRLLVASISLALTLLLSKPAQAQPPLDAVDAIVRAELTRQQVPGIALAVVSKGSVLKAAGYGEANVEHRIAVTPQTIFQSGSLGKQFTAVALMRQVEAGRLSLSDPLSKFFQGAPASWRAITVRHLLTHTSGIPDYTQGLVDYRRDYSEDELVKLAYRLKPQFPAGAHWDYSNTGYVLLGILIRKVSGRFYGEVLQAEVFEPLGMKTARVISEADLIPHRAAGYQLVEGQLKNQDWVAPQLNTTADGSLYLSLDDLLAWEQAVRARRILKPESWQQVFAPVRLNSGKTYPYGFGWFVDDFSGQPRQHHSGSWQGFKTYFSRYLGDDLSVIVLGNSADFDPEIVVDLVAAALEPSLARPTQKLEDPAATTRLLALLHKTASGKLRSADFAYHPVSLFSGGKNAYQDSLAALGEPVQTHLLSRRTLGDDEQYRFEVAYAKKTLHVTFALSPQGKLTSLRMRRQ